MYWCSDYALAIAFCVVTMLCWGSWGNAQKLAGRKWRYELFYWDYVVGVVLFALAAGLTAGSHGGGAWSFAANLRQASAANVGSAFLGGVVFNAANILLSAAMAVAGMSVAFPVGIGLALILGVVVNYAGEPKGDPALLFGGVALVAAAILCNAAAHAAKSRRRQRRGRGGARPSPARGMALSVACGVLMALFYRFVARTMDMDFAAPAPRPGTMTPYSAFFVFSLGVFASNFVFNTIAMRHPAEGEPVSWRAYFRGGFAIHLVGILGGAVWGLGNGLNLVAAGTAGAAVSYGLGQGATLVSALWGVLVWREFRGAPRRAAVLNAAMFALFLAGLGAIVAAGRDGGAGASGGPVKIILDSDMYEDYDDMGALAILHAMADAGECEILGTFSCTRRNGSVAALEICNAWYGRPDIPVGCSKLPSAVSGRPAEHGKFVALQASHPGSFRHADSDDAPDAVDEYRRILAAQPDGSVVVCSIGFFTNLRGLLESGPDGHSPLAGRDLVAAKVRKWVAMGLFYPDGHEYNSDGDAASTRIALRDWPTPVVVSDFQYGRHLYAGRAVAERGADGGPVSEIFGESLLPRDRVTPRTWDQLAGHPSWDESAVLAAVRGEESLFAVERGFYEVTRDDGYCVWRHDPASPHCRLLVKAPREEVGRVIDELMLRAPRRR